MNFTRIFILSVCICFFNSIYGQYIQAGKHICPSTYTGYSPYLDITPYSYNLDLNGDSIYDFKLYHLSQFGGTYSDTWCYIEPIGQNQIAFSHVDTLKTNCGVSNIYRDIPKFFNTNDTINSNRIWKNNIMYFDEYHKVTSCYDWLQGINTMNNIVGLRIISLNDTLYGWINFKSTSSTFLRITDFACEIHFTMVQPTITQTGSILTSNHTTGNQWFRNDTLISGATTQNYTMTQNGYYSLVVIENGCTSDTISINMIDLSAQEYNNNKILHINPNPFTDNLLVTLNSNLLGTKWELYNQIGEIVISGIFETIDNKIKINNLPGGVYFFKTERSTTKLIKIIP